MPGASRAAWLAAIGGFARMCVLTAQALRRPFEWRRLSPARCKSGGAAGSIVLDIAD